MKELMKNIKYDVKKSAVDKITEPKTSRNVKDKNGVVRV